MEEITLEESTTETITPLLHETVKRIISENQTPDAVQKDLLFMVIVVLMIENGFMPVDNELHVIDLMKSFDMVQLSKWKQPTGICEATFVLSGFTSTLKLIMCPLGATVLVNIVVTELNFETYSICLPVSRYVVSPQASSIPMIFRDLKHFSVTIKNQILSTVKSRILTHNGYASASLPGLPEEVLLNILLNLPIADILNMCKTCSRLKLLLDNQCLWHLLNKRDFRISDNVDIVDWKELYQQNYLMGQESKSRPSWRFGNPEHLDLMSHVDDPLWDIII